MGAQSRPAQLSPWGKAIAGSVAAMGANLLVYPLDLAKTRLQVQTKSDEVQYAGTLDVIRKVYEQGGLKALYAGLGGTLLGVASTNFAYFYWYSLVRGTYIKRQGTQNISTAAELVLGAVAGALAQLFTIPVSVITTRQQTSKTDAHSSFLTTAKHVIDEDGPSGLWRGLKASLILVVNPSITYGSSSRLRTALFGDKPVLNVADNFLLGAMSKAMATIATQPMIVAKVMQQSSEKGKKHFASFQEALAYLVKNEGLKGLFKGIGPQLSKGILVQGILLAMKDRVEHWMLVLFQVLAKRRLALA